MFRKRDGSLSFSLNRLISNTNPVFANDHPAEDDADLSQQRQDMLYAHQLNCIRPSLLDPLAFYVAGVVDREPLSRRIHAALIKSGVLSDTNPNNPNNTTIRTANIGPNFAHQLAFIPVVAQRKCVGVLFYWEEEVQRLRKLDAEEEELTALILQATNAGGVGDGVDQARLARERVRMKRRQKPSERLAAVEADTDSIVERTFRHDGREAEQAEVVRHDGALPPTYSSRP